MNSVSDRHIFMLGPDPKTRGGIASVIESYIKSGFLKKYQIRYIATHVDGTKWDKLRIAICAWVAFIQALIKHQVLAVHLHAASDISFPRKSVFLVSAYLFRVPILLHIHGGDFQDYYSKDSSIIKQALIRRILKMSNKVLVLSAFWHEWFKQWLPENKIQVLPNPVEVAEIVKSKPEPMQILSMGTLDARKGVFELLSAFQKLIKKYPNLRLVYAGSGELFEELQARVQALNLQNQVHLAGWVRGAEKSVLLQQSSIFVLPSYNENFPVALLEAMSAEIPSVVTAVGGVVDIIQDGENGLLISPGDVDGIVAKVSQLLDDETLRKSIGAKGRQYVLKNCALESVMSSLASIYRDLNLLNESA